ncbi:hypothetical protein OUZ56_024046 [Daphnia magna]|uniref:Uncharacterized protein n=1 Tax=Daphnia magna TaxID=35525 RepID=A0ABR0B0N4_9CRUS|nr:hypothetical protein OUZ56_024046 [Daphnia magna]
MDDDPGSPEANDELHTPKEVFPRSSSKEYDEFLLQKESDIPQDDELHEMAREFQLGAMRAYSCKKDSIVIQATGAGKNEISSSKRI